jgi:electron transfer flavoprotein beta subunit
MKILVCITYVPDTTSRIAFTEGNTRFDSNGVQYIIGPYDEYALARAVELKESNGATVTVFHVGEAEAEPVIRKALAIGADDAIRVNAVAKDAAFVAAQIAAHIASTPYDLVLMGRESIDYNGGLVPAMVAARLQWPIISPVMKLDFNGTEATMLREIEGGKETVTCALPFVAACQEPIAEWKIPNMRGIMAARTKPLNVVDPVQEDSGVSYKQYSTPAPRSGCKMIDAANPEELLTLLKNEAKVL